MPEINVVTPAASNSLERLVLGTSDVRRGSDAQQWGNPTCPTCLCNAEDA